MTGQTVNNTAVVGRIDDRLLVLTAEEATAVLSGYYCVHRIADSGADSGPVIG